MNAFPPDMRLSRDAGIRCACNSAAMSAPAVAPIENTPRKCSMDSVQRRGTGFQTA